MCQLMVGRVDIEEGCPLQSAFAYMSYLLYIVRFVHFHPQKHLMLIWCMVRLQQRLLPMSVCR